MKTHSGNTLLTLLALVLLEATLAAQQTTAPAQPESTDATTTSAASPLSMPVLAASQARIVRLSDIQGTVQIDRNTGQGFEKALLNLPITEGTTLRTASGLAEVEFEDDSSLRIIPSTTIAFPQLELLNSGATASTVNLREGTVYLSLVGDKNKEFTLTFGSQKLTLMPSSHIRLHMGHAKAKLAVFNGKVQVQGPSGMTVVGKKKTLIFDLAGQNQPTLVKHVAQNVYDAGDQQQIDYHKKYAKSTPYGSLPYAYGVTDLNYYGSFVSAPGCDSLWRPFFASASWDPYMSGVWAWYPGSGYCWVSSYPWGWMPFHSGAWEFCPAYGWGWQPGRSWVGLHNPPKPVKPPHGFPVPRPPLPPAPGCPQLLAVNRAPLAVSTLTSPERFVIRNDSAGLGVPRGSLGSLGKLSSQVQQRGSLNLAVTSTGHTPASEARTAGSVSVSSARSGSASRTGSASYSHSSMAAAHSSGGMGSGSAAGGMGHMGGGGGSMSSGGGGSAHR
jgi:FecR protein